MNNNPINLIDPSGHETCDDDGYCASKERGKHRAYIRIDPLAPTTTGKEKGKGTKSVHNPTDDAIIPAFPGPPSGPPFIEPIPGQTNPPSQSEADKYFQGIDYLNNFLGAVGIIADGLGKVYKPLKYTASLGGAEYAIDAAIQVHKDWNKDLNFGQRFIRGAGRFAESVVIDALSTASGVFTGGLAQIAFPAAPGAALAGGYIAGAYSVSASLDQLATNSINPCAFTTLGLGGP